MNRENDNIRKYGWLTGQLLIVGMLIMAGGIVGRTLVTDAVQKGKVLYRHYSRKNAAKEWPEEKKLLKKETAQLDSILTRMEERQLQAGGTLIDEIYSYASDAGFRTEKVEVGIPQKTGSRIETSVTVKGSGKYRSLGKLVEKIENNIQSTRIRQLTMSGKKNKELGVFIDVVVREEIPVNKKGVSGK